MEDIKIGITSNIDGKSYQGFIIEISHGYDMYWYPLSSFSIKEAIIEFLNQAGIDKSDNKRCAILNESIEKLMSDNKELNILLETSMQLSERLIKENELLKRMLLIK